MINFKEIAEKCLAGELSGTFKLMSGKFVSSDNLERAFGAHRNSTYQYQMYVNKALLSYTIYGTLFSFQPNSLDIIDFIPDNMKEQIKIDIPEGKIPVMEQTENGVFITWKEKELTYKDIENKIILKNNHDCIIGYTKVIEDIKTFNCLHSDFYKKVEVLRKLTNIRNYFGKPSKKNSNYGWVICSDGVVYKAMIEHPHLPVFTKKEHAEQAIKMLGDELKYLFEPW